MESKILAKDFEIKGVRVGSRLQGGPEWAYEIYFNAPTGKKVRLNKTFYTKEAARKYIRETIKLAKELVKAKEAKR